MLKIAFAMQNSIGKKPFKQRKIIVSLYDDQAVLFLFI